MTILTEERINLTDEYKVFIRNYVNYAKQVNSKDIFEGLNDKQILKNKFIFKIYELSNLDMAKVRISINDNQISIFARLWDSDDLKIGSIQLTERLKEILSEKYYLTLNINGGNLKKVVVNDLGEDCIENSFEPYRLSLEIHEKEDIDYKSKKIDTLYQYAFKTEHSLVVFSKILMCCIAIIGLALGLGFMFLGFFMTGIMVIIAFFGINSYALLIYGSQNQEHPK